MGALRYGGVRPAGVRERLRAGGQRLRRTWFAIAQCALGAALAWEFATLVLGHTRPFFASVAAIVALGVSYTQRLRRVLELAVGVALGVAIGDLLIREIGGGAWQIAVVVAIGMGTAQLLDGGNLITNQAGLQAIFVTVIPPPAGGNVTRWEDAVVGGVIALLVAALLPPDPRREVRRRAAFMITELADVIGDAARSVRAGDAAVADATLDRVRDTQPELDRWEDSLRAGEEISKISPLRRHRRGELARYRTALVGVDRATRNMRVAVRRIASVLDAGGTVPLPLADVLEDLARAVHLLGDGLTYPDAGDFAIGAQGEATAALAQLAARLRPERLIEHAGLSSTVIIGQIRSAVVDLLGAAGVDVEEARKLLPAPPPRPSPAN